jgi:hypothetical protein
MSDATLPLQVAVVALVDADATIRGLVPLGILDPIPQGTEHLYLRPTGWQEIEDGTDCSDAVRVVFEIQCYAPPPARDDLARLAGAVKRVLHKATPVVAGFAEVEILYRDTLYFDEPDGLSRRAVVRFEALADEA